MPEAPTATLFTNDISTTAAGEGRLTVRHVAAAPAVDILAGGTAVVEDLTNPNEATLNLARRHRLRGRRARGHDRPGHRPGRRRRSRKASTRSSTPGAAPPTATSPSPCRPSPACTRRPTASTRARPVWSQRTAPRRSSGASASSSPSVRLSRPPWASGQSARAADTPRREQQESTPMDESPALIIACACCSPSWDARSPPPDTPIAGASEQPPAPRPARHPPRHRRAAILERCSAGHRTGRTRANARARRIHRHVDRSGRGAGRRIHGTPAGAERRRLVPLRRVPRESARATRCSRPMSIPRTTESARSRTCAISRAAPRCRLKPRTAGSPRYAVESVTYYPRSASADRGVLRPRRCPGARDHHVRRKLRRRKAVVQR